MFEPYVGKAWGSPTNILSGSRLLVLGESHYNDDPAMVGKSEPDGTAKIVEKYALDEPARFFTGITQVVAGRPKRQMSREELTSLWDALAFANYVPVYAATGPRVRPTLEMFEMAKATFASSLEALKPQAVVVCGYNLWGWVMRGLGQGEPKPWETPSPHKVGDIRFFRMMHPSAAFSWRKWHPTVQDALGREAP